MIFIYASFNPTESGLFPKCPIRMLTGLRCPGCGSQRAIHHLLNGNIAAAWHVNQLLIVAIPYLILGYFAELLQRRSRRALAIRKRLYGATAAWIALTIIVCFTVLRNLLEF
jgi:hypothetical protein